MKVCIASHCFPPLKGAAEMYIGNLARELSRLGVEVSVVTVATGSNTPAFEEMDGVRVYRQPNAFPYNFKNYGFMFNCSSLLSKVWEKESFDILHSEHIFPIPRGGIFAKKKGIPHLGVIEGISRVSLYSKLVYFTHRHYLPRSKYTTLVAWSRFLADEFFRRWGVDKEKIRIIPGAIDVKQFNPYVDGEEVRESLTDGSESKIIFTAKPLYHTNALGVRYILEAMKEVVRERRDATLIIAGDGRKRKDLQRLARTLELRDHVRFIGWVPQHMMPKYYAASDIIVDSIIYNHAGSVTVMETLASGRPNVLCNIHCLPGENGFPSSDIAVLVKPRDPKSMADGILRLLGDKDLGKVLGRNAWKFVFKNYSIDVVAYRYKKLYEELIS